MKTLLLMTPSLVRLPQYYAATQGAVPNFEQLKQEQPEGGTRNARGAKHSRSEFGLRLSADTLGKTEVGT